MSRQHSNPVYLPVGGSPRALSKIEFSSEGEIQDFVHRNPESLPIGEIDAAFLNPIPVCREMMTPVGPLDNFMVTASGMPVLVECKLWRNPQARREVVGQVLDYAKELSRWTSADIEREARRRGVPSLIEHVRKVAPDVDEAYFHDSLSRNLAKGRCLLLIVGDGIREGVEAIFEHLRSQAILHFSLGLVELPVFAMPDGSKVVTPRLLARTAIEVRRVVEVPQGMLVEDDGEDDLPKLTGPAEDDIVNKRLVFWKEYLSRLRLDDTEQVRPNAGKNGWLQFNLPVPDKKCWIVVYRDVAAQSVGLYFLCVGSGISSAVAREVQQRVEEVLDDLKEDAAVGTSKDGGFLLREVKKFGDIDSPEGRASATEWLAERTNHWINVLRPLVRSIAADLEERGN